jgi:hypothetical protein
MGVAATDERDAADEDASRSFPAGIRGERQARICGLDIHAVPGGEVAAHRAPCLLSQWRHRSGGSTRLPSVTLRLPVSNSTLAKVAALNHAAPVKAAKVNRAFLTVH